MTNLTTPNDRLWTTRTMSRWHCEKQQAETGVDTICGRRITYDEHPYPRHPADVDALDVCLVCLRGLEAS